VVGNERWVYAIQAVGIVCHDLRPYQSMRSLERVDASRELAWACERGEVRSRYRDTSDGAIKEIPPDVWHPGGFDWVRGILHLPGPWPGSRPCSDSVNCATACFHEVQIHWRDLCKWIDRAKIADATLKEILQPPLKRASTRRIHETIRAVNNAAASKAEPVPNINKLAAEVKHRLKAANFDATVRRIREAAKAPEHAERRRLRGKTLASERQRKPE
jgi:hypothetical protein